MLKILIVMDPASKRDLTDLETKYQEQAKFRRAGDLDNALDYLDRGDVSYILLDSALTDIDGRDIYGTLREKHPTVPIGLLVGENNTRLLDAGDMSFQIYDGTSDAVIFNRIVMTVERVGPRVSLPTFAAQGRLEPSVTTKPPRNRVQVDVVEGIPIEERLTACEREVRFHTWLVAMLIVIALSVALSR